MAVLVALVVRRVDRNILAMPAANSSIVGCDALQWSSSKGQMHKRAFGALPNELPSCREQMLVAHQCVNSYCERPRACVSISESPEPPDQPAALDICQPYIALSLYLKSLHLWPKALTLTLLDAPPIGPLTLTSATPNPLKPPAEPPSSTYQHATASSPSAHPDALCMCIVRTPEPPSRTHSRIQRTSTSQRTQIRAPPSIVKLRADLASRAHYKPAGIRTALDGPMHRRSLDYLTLTCRAEFMSSHWIRGSN